MPAGKLRLMMMMMINKRALRARLHLTALVLAIAASSLLRSECWKSFKAYVQSFAGWKAVRRLATEVMLRSLQKLARSSAFTHACA